MSTVDDLMAMAFQNRIDDPMGTAATELRAALESALKVSEQDGCPCLLVEPCSANCSCANPVMSGGCARCARHGSWEQRVAAAKRLAAAPEQAAEPVAWQSPDGSIREDEGQGEPPFDDWRPLYASPPKREPLPGKKIELLIYEHTKLNPNQADDRELITYIVNAVRAVERAHGIGDE